MENAVEALMIAFAVFVFCTASTITMQMFTECRQTSNYVLYYSDETNYYDYEQATSNSDLTRIVGIETIIPTLYNYYKENYTVWFKDANNKDLELFTSKCTAPSEYNNPYFNKVKFNANKKVCSFDVNEEYSRRELWTGNEKEMKKNLDAYIKGDSYTYLNKTMDYGTNGFLKRFGDKKFRESIGYYTYTSGTTTSTKKVIIYTLVN